MPRRPAPGGGGGSGGGRAGEQLPRPRVLPAPAGRTRRPGQTRTGMCECGLCVATGVRPCLPLLQQPRQERCRCLLIGLCGCLGERHLPCTGKVLVVSVRGIQELFTSCLGARAASVLLSQHPGGGGGGMRSWRATCVSPPAALAWHRRVGVLNIYS